MSDKALQRNLHLSFEVDPQLSTQMHGDPHRLSQILINYTNNALKFTETGAIKVRVHKVKIRFVAGSSNLKWRIQASA